MIAPARVIPIGLLLVAGACGFDSSGKGDANNSIGESSSDATSTSSTSSPTTSPATSDATSNGPTTAPSTSTTSTATTDPSGEESSTQTGTTTGVIDCNSPPPFAKLMMAADGTVVLPMVLGPSWGGLNGSPMVASSPVAEAGTITFDFEVPCAGTYHLWALSWDRYHGSGFSCGVTPNPDSFYVSYDGGGELYWNFGCDTCSLPDTVWAWAKVSAYLGNPCVTAPFEMNLAAGSHSIQFRNREAALNIDVVPNIAALAAIVVANDENHDPNIDFPP